MLEDITLRIRGRWQHILATLLLILALSPTPLHGQWVDAVERASIALKAGQVGPALTEIDKALEAEPALASLHLLASDLAYFTGDVELSQAYLQEVPETWLEEPQQLCRRVRMLISGESDPVWSASFKRALASCPQIFQQVKVELLHEFSAAPQPDLLAPLQTLHEIDPADREILQAYCRLLGALDPHEAVEHLREIVRVESDSADLEREILLLVHDAQDRSQATTLAEVGQIYARYQHWGLAALSFQRAVELEPDYSLAWAYLGLAFEQTGGDGSSEILRARSELPMDPRPHVFLAIHLVKAGQPNRARASLDTAAALDPENPAIAAQLGSVYAEIGDFSAATQAYLAAAELAPDDGRFWLLLASFSLEHDLDLVGIGLPAARNAVSIDPQNPRAHEKLGAIHFNLDNFMLAERSLRTALSLDGRAPSAQYNYGLLMLAFGRRQAADAAFRAASILDEGGQYADLSARFLQR